ncbi:MAG: ATP-binding cassette domain-containing protein, partial [Flavihumibacter sp.]
AIVGESGSGKSSLLSLLQNLYPLKEGSITIGGIDLNHFSTASLRKVIGVVPQQIDLFAGTIIENIAVGDLRPDLQRLLTVSQITGLHEVVEKLPGHYETVLSENGVNLSGGQRQRLAIARALYRNPEILILDEATSNLDPASERKVQEAINWFRQQHKTVIIIAHRLSTIRHADEIIVLKDGKVAQQGSHETLLQSDNLYSQYWMS